MRITYATFQNENGMWRFHWSQNPVISSSRISRIGFRVFALREQSADVFRWAKDNRAHFLAPLGGASLQNHDKTASSETRHHLRLKWVADDVSNIGWRGYVLRESPPSGAWKCLNIVLSSTNTSRRKCSPLERHEISQDAWNGSLEMPDFATETPQPFSIRNVRYAI